MDGVISDELNSTWHCSYSSGVHFTSLQFRDVPTARCCPGHERLTLRFRKNFKTKVIVVRHSDPDSPVQWGTVPTWPLTDLRAVTQRSWFVFWPRALTSRTTIVWLLQHVGNWVCVSRQPVLMSSFLGVSLVLMPRQPAGHQRATAPVWTCGCFTVIIPIVSCWERICRTEGFIVQTKHLWYKCSSIWNREEEKLRFVFFL